MASIYSSYRTKAYAVQPCTRERAVAAIHRFYQTLIDVAYLPPDALLIPPSNGWQNINEQELRRRGKTDTAIDLIRHLPYLDNNRLRENSHDRRAWELAWYTMHINYCQDDVPQVCVDYYPYPEPIIKFPNHTVLLSTGNARDGLHWVLDTEDWSITEWTLMGETQMRYVSEEFEKSQPLEEKWREFFRLDAETYFSEWIKRLLSLECIYIYTDKTYWNGSAKILWRDSYMQNHHLMEGSLEKDDIDDGGEYQPSENGRENDDDDDTSDVSTDASIDGDIEMTDEPSGWTRLDMQDLSVSELELNELKEEKLSLLPPLASDPYSGIEEVPNFQLSTPRKVRSFESKEREQIREVDTIYRRRGWPDHFDREGCRQELIQWLVDMNAKEEAERKQRERNPPASDVLKKMKMPLLEACLGEHIQRSLNWQPYALEHLEKLDGLLVTASTEDFKKSKICDILQRVIDAPKREGIDISELQSRAFTLLTRISLRIADQDSNI